MERNRATESATRAWRSEADLAVVKTTFATDKVAAAVAHIFELAGQRRQPCVINLSLGNHFGGHDGSTVAERTIDQLAGAGRLVVVSAGNEGGDALHASTVLTPGSSKSAAGEMGREFLRLLTDLHQTITRLDVVLVWLGVAPCRV